jgi:hypothetical protein
MKATNCLLICLLLLLPLAAHASGSGTETVTLTVQQIDNLVVPATVGFEFATTTDGQSYPAATVHQTGAVSFSHNSSSTEKISASAVHDGGNGTNDVNLYVGTSTILHASSPEVVKGGSDNGSKNVITGVAAGHHAYDLYWECSGATLGVTPAGTYHWTVTFTTSAG